MTSTQCVTAVFHGAVRYSYFCGIWELIFRIPWKTIGPKEISFAQNEKEAFWETSLFSVNSSNRVTDLPSWSRSLRLFLWNLKGYLEAHRGLWWKRKYPQMKTGKKLSEKLLCDVWLPRTDLQLRFMELFASLISVESDNWYFGSIWRLYGQRKYPPMKIRKKFSEKLPCVLSIHLTELQLSRHEAFR